ncbi:MAG: hypothetical protein H7Y59_11955 [Anaerolineales bacterium]|nr:hypothetical protein [Anaerolineales bacterium]
MTEKSKLQLNLLENAYDYLNSSLEYVVRAKTTDAQRLWKFAILHIAFCIELMLKERLRRAHELLIYATIDKFKPITRETKTAPWNIIVERIKYVMGNRFEEIDAGRLALAQRLRNQILHYDVELEFPTVYQDFSNLLNLVRELHKEIRESEEETLHQHVDHELLEEESALSEAFIEDIVHFNGIFMSKELRDDILDEQKQVKLLIDGEEYFRITFGSTDEWIDIDTNYSIYPCHDCAVIKGQIHLLGCDMERCPRCKEQLLSCGCNYEYLEPT